MTASQCFTCRQKISTVDDDKMQSRFLLFSHSYLPLALSILKCVDPTSTPQYITQSCNNFNY